MSTFQILYLDKDKHIASRVKPHLETKGYCVFTANSEQEVTSNNQHFDLLIIDFLTPTINAFSFLHFLKAQEISTPTIFVHTKSNSQLNAKILKQDKIGFVLKQSSTQDFLNQLSLCIAQKIPKNTASLSIPSLNLNAIADAKEAIFIADANKNIISINPAFSRISGYSAQDVLNQKSDMLNIGYFNNQYFNSVAKILKNKLYWQGEVLIRHKKDYSLPIWQSIYILKDNTGKISQSISVLRDLKQQKSIEKNYFPRENYDALTQLPNRKLFVDRFNSELNRAKRNNKKIALLLLDLNKFKSINVKYGYPVGDVLLQATAKSLLSSIRKSDTVARLRGDKFCILLPELEKIADAKLIAHKIFQAFNQPIIIDQQQIFIHGSIGISIFPSHGSNIESLQNNAENAMQIAKGLTDNSVFCYNPPTNQQTEKDKRKLITALHTAIVNQEFHIHYQPIIDLKTNTVNSAEALLRWKHPKTGYVPLSEFIPLAEESGLIRDIGNWVITEVANNIQHWSSLKLPAIEVSINQSIIQYSLPECHVTWLEILAEKQVSPKLITFELSEKIFLEGSNYRDSIDKLKQAGVKIALDSFGSGDSSLSYLKKFPINLIKIDRSYIKKMVDSPTYSILVETIITLTSKLDLDVIAIGVETKEQLDMLKPRCQYAQGYYFSEPLPLAAFEKYIAEKNNT